MAPSSKSIKIIKENGREEYQFESSSPPLVRMAGNWTF
jgi:hypothetical protein